MSEWEDNQPMERPGNEWEIRATEPGEPRVSEKFVEKHAEDIEDMIDGLISEPASEGGVMKKEKDLHELVGFAKLLVRMGLITNHQAIMAMNIPFGHYERGGWPEELPGEPSEKEADHEQG